MRYYYLRDKGRCSEWLRNVPKVTQLVKGRVLCMFMLAASMEQNHFFRRAWWQSVSWAQGVWAQELQSVATTVTPSNPCFLRSASSADLSCHLSLMTVEATQ